MSLESSKMTKKRRKMAYGIAALCGVILFGLVLFPYYAASLAEGAETNVATVPTPIPLPSATTLPVASPGPTSTPSSTPAATPVPSPSPGGNGANPRDLSQYENAGTITLGTTTAAIDASMTQFRSFVLRKWNTRQPGRVILISAGPTNRPMTRRFYVERDTAGTWMVTMESQNDISEFYVVEEIGVTSDGRPILDPRPGGPQAASRALHMKPTTQARSGIVL